MSAELQSALRAQYSETDWLTVIGPINDTARIKQRDALVAYILQQLGDRYADSVISEATSAAAAPSSSAPAAASSAPAATSAPASAPASVAASSPAAAAGGAINACMVLDTGGVDDHSFNQS